jgi:hypothetical protein
MHELLRELHADQKTALRYEVNGDSVQWWVADHQRREAAKTAKAPAKLASSPSYAWVWVLIFMVGVPLLQWVGKASNERLEHDLRPTYTQSEPRAVVDLPNITLNTKPAEPALASVWPAWNSGKLYLKGALVSHAGHAWIAETVVPIGGQPPGASPNWRRMD